MSYSGVLAAPSGWDPPPWDEIVRDHRSRVYRLAYRLTGNSHDAEDLTQDVFVRVFRSLSTYRPGSFEGWLHRITTNLFLDGLRRRARQRTQPLEAAGLDRLGDADPEPGQALHDATLEEDVQAALDALPADFRAAVLLCDVHGLSYEEVGELLGIKLGTVRSRIHRGRRQMRQALAHRAPGSVPAAAASTSGSVRAQAPPGA
jgi:RNA polymerase sigma-70 factor (ECF subfamily)